MFEQAFVQRTFEVDGQDVICRFSRPVRDERAYRCDYEIEWPERSRSVHIFGVDEVQALLLAMQTAHVELLAARENDGRQVLWLGDRSLGLPLAPGPDGWDPERRM